MKSTKKGEAFTLPKYPSLYINREGNVVVMMFSYGQGVVVYAEDASPHHVGLLVDDWDMGVFNLYGGEITLSNGV